MKFIETSFLASEKYVNKPQLAGTLCKNIDEVGMIELLIFSVTGMVFCFMWQDVSFFEELFKEVNKEEVEEVKGGMVTEEMLLKTIAMLANQEKLSEL